MKLKSSYKIFKKNMTSTFRSYQNGLSSYWNLDFADSKLLIVMTADAKVSKTKTVKLKLVKDEECITLCVNNYDLFAFFTHYAGTTLV